MKVKVRMITYLLSIHTPARGVTALPHRLHDGLPISIHTPARGVTQSRHIDQSFP